MTDVRKEFEKLLGYKPHWKMGDEKMQSLMDAYLKKHPNPVVEVEAPPLEPSQLDTPVVPDTRTPEQIEQDIINEAAASVPEFIPVPEKVEVTEEKAKEMAETVSDNPLMTAMAMLLTSQTRTNELLEQMNKNLQNNIVPIDQRVTPPEALKNLTEAQEKAPLTTQKRFKVLILRADLTASDGGQDRAESGQIFYSDEDARAFGEKHAPGLTQDGKQRYRIYHESVVLPSNLEEGKTQY